MLGRCNASHRITSHHINSHQLQLNSNDTPQRSAAHTALGFLTKHAATNPTKSSLHSLAAAAVGLVVAAAAAAPEAAGTGTGTDGCKITRCFSSLGAGACGMWLITLSGGRRQLGGLPVVSSMQVMPSDQMSALPSYWFCVITSGA